MEWLSQAQDWLATQGTAFAVGVVTFVLVLLAGRIVIGAIDQGLGRRLRQSERIDETLGAFLTGVARKGLWVLVLLVALGQLGLDIGPLIAGLGVAGFIIGFAFQESLGNLAAGLMILLNRPFQVGDYVEAAGEAGTVTELNFMATTLTTPDNKVITAPNRSIWASPITNHTAKDTRRAEWTVGVGYDADIGRAIETVQAVLAEDERVLAEPAPFIEVRELADSSVNLVVRAWTSSDDLWPVYFQAQRSFKERLEAAGIEIPFPQLDVHYYDASAS